MTSFLRGIDDFLISMVSWLVASRKLPLYCVRFFHSILPHLITANKASRDLEFQQTRINKIFYLVTFIYLKKIASLYRHCPVNLTRITIKFDSFAQATVTVTTRIGSRLRRPSPTFIGLLFHRFGRNTQTTSMSSRSLNLAIP